MTETADIAAVLTPLLRDESGYDDLQVTPSGSAGGQSHAMTLFDLRWSDRQGTHKDRVVLRRQPAGEGSIFLNPDVVQEARVLAGIGRAGTVAVPRIWLACAATDPLGAPFFVMSLVEGRPIASKPSIHTSGWLLDVSAEARSRLWDGGLAALAAVHAIDWRRDLAFLLDGPEDDTLGTYLRQLRHWYDWVREGRAFPITDAAFQYLDGAAARVDAGPPVLVWGDARPGNLLFGPDNTVRAVIDWELATIGPAGIDLGYWLFMDAFHAEAIGVQRLPGVPDSAETVARYEKYAGRTLADLHYFQVLGATMMAGTIIRQGNLKARTGAWPTSTRIGHANSVTQFIAQRLDLPVPELDPDWVSHRGLPA